jgi:hypothetical protein
VGFTDGVQREQIKQLDCGSVWHSWSKVKSPSSNTRTSNLRLFWARPISASDFQLKKWAMHEYPKTKRAFDGGSFETAAN